MRVPVGLRWSCHGCGDCCTGHAIGPVEPEVIAGLEAGDIASLWEPAALGWRDERTGPEGQVEVYLRQVAGACVFLRPDRRCAIHASLGASAKPGFCREFPYTLLDDPQGTVAVIRATCAGFHRSFRDGDSVTESEVEAIASLPRVVPRGRFAPHAVELCPGRVVPLPEWMALEATWLAALEPCDLDPRALLALLRADVTSDPSRPPQHEAAFQALLAALAHVMRGVLAGPPGEPHQVDFARDSLALLEAASRQPAAPLDAEARDWLNLLLRSALLGKAWAAWGSVAAGLGVWAAGIEIARRTSDGTPAGIAPVLAHWERFTAIPLVQLWLNKARPATVDLFLHSA